MKWALVFLFIVSPAYAGPFDFFTNLFGGGNTDPAAVETDTTETTEESSDEAATPEASTEETAVDETAVDETSPEETVLDETVATEDTTGDADNPPITPLSDGTCPIQTLMDASANNKRRVTFTKRFCEADGQSSQDNGVNYRGYRMSWGPEPGFKADIMPLNFQVDPDNKDRGILTYYKAGAHIPGVTQHFAERDGRMCNGSEDGTEYVCPRQRVFFCKEGKLQVIDPAGNEWEVKTEALSPEQVRSEMAEVPTGPAEAATSTEATTSTDANPVAENSVSSSVCHISGQIPPESHMQALFPPTYPKPEDFKLYTPAETPTAPASDGVAPGGDPDATPTAPN